MNFKNTTLANFISRFGFAVNVALLTIHISFLVMFALLKVNIMVYMNIVSVITYLSLFVMLNKNTTLYLILVNIEIVIHMTLATFCVGWDYGFQFYCLANVPIAFYNDYLSQRSSGKRTYPVIFSMVIMVIFITVRMITLEIPPIYPLEHKTICSIIFSANIIVIFMFLIVYMTVYENLTLDIESKLKYNAEYDELTGLANRHRTNEMFKQILGKASKGKVQLAVAILDIDNFKKVNDRYGHDTGDKALQTLADILRSVESRNDFACRWGGEEFLIVGTDEDCFARISDKAEEVRTKLMNCDVPVDDENAIRISISAGVTFYNGGENIEHTIARADKFLYEAKSSGKNKVITDNETARTV